MLALLLALALQNPEPAPRPSEIVVRGEVVDSGGVPIPGVRCSVIVQGGVREHQRRPIGPESRTRVASTGADGRFELRMAPEVARVDLFVDDAVRLPHRQHWFVEDEGGDLDAGRIVLYAPTRLSVAILDSKGELEFEGWDVTLRPYPLKPGSGLASKRDGERACFEFERVEPGRSMVMAHFRDGTRISELLELSPEQETHVVLRRESAAAARRLQVRFVDDVTGAPVRPPEDLFAVGANGERLPFERGERGVWRTGSVRPQRYLLSVDVPEYKRARVVLIPGELRTLKLVGKASLTVRLVDESGAPIERGVVRVGKAGAERVAARLVGEPASHVLDGLPLGRTRVRATAPGRRPASRSVELIADTQSIEIGLVPVGRLRAVLRRPDGEPAVGALVVGRSLAHGTPTFARSDSSGTCELRLEELGGYQVHVVRGPSTGRMHRVLGAEPQAHLDLESGWVADVVGRIAVRDDERGALLSGQLGVLVVRTGENSRYESIAGGARTGGGAAEWSIPLADGVVACTVGGRPSGRVADDGSFRLVGVGLEGVGLVLVRLDPMQGGTVSWASLRALAPLELPPPGDPVWATGILDVGVVGAE